MLSRLRPSDTITLFIAAHFAILGAANQHIDDPSR
jgi:hypothetical protein